jgi:hypothetical protein
LAVVTEASAVAVAVVSLEELRLEEQVEAQPLTLEKMDLLECLTIRGEQLEKVTEETVVPTQVVVQEDVETRQPQQVDLV